MNPSSIPIVLIDGKLYWEIAQALGMSIDTVRGHIRKVYDKLHIHSRTEIIMKFGKRGRGLDQTSSIAFRAL